MGIICISSVLVGSILDKYTSYILKQHGKKYETDRIKSVLRYVLRVFYMGIIFSLCYFKYGKSLTTFMLMSFCSILTLLSLIDLKCMVLPTQIIIMGSILGIIFRMLLSIQSHNLNYLIEGAIAGVVGYAWFYIIYFLCTKIMHKEGLGFGDVRVMGMLGIFIGIWKLSEMLLLACTMAIVVGVILLIIRRKSRPYPFGPFLCSATMMMLIWGS